MRAFFAWLREVFSEAGSGSYSRFAAGFIVIMTCGWVTYVVIHTKTIPDLTGPAFFLTVGAGMHYGTNKATDIISAFKLPKSGS